jgi:hypothetical protein
MEVIENVLPPLKVDDNSTLYYQSNQHTNMVSILFVDRGRGDAANFLVVIIEEKYGKFRIWTKEGI